MAENRKGTGAGHVRASLRRGLNARLELILRECEQERVRREAGKWGHGDMGQGGDWDTDWPQGRGH